MKTSKTENTKSSFPCPTLGSSWGQQSPILLKYGNYSLHSHCMRRIHWDHRWVLAASRMPPQQRGTLRRHCTLTSQKRFWEVQTFRGYHSSRRLGRSQPADNQIKSHHKTEYSYLTYQRHQAFRIPSFVAIHVCPVIKIRSGSTGVYHN